MRILGISAFYHDSAAALVRDGEIIAAAQEERFTRKKHDSRFPSKAVEYCLAQDRVGLSDVDFVAFYDKPFLKFERLLRNLCRVCSKRVAVVRDGDAPLGSRKAFSKEPITQ